MTRIASTRNVGRMTVYRGLALGGARPSTARGLPRRSRLGARHYGGRSVALVLDEDPAHTAEDWRVLTDDLDIELSRVPKRVPELDSVDGLWRHVKDPISANRHYPTVDEHADRFFAYCEAISDRDTLRFAGVHSANFCLNDKP